jgi:hypothetical protein
VPYLRPDHDLLAVYPRLTDRDRQLLQLLDDHRVLTTGQIHRLLFTARRTCQLRLARLQRLSLLHNFRFFRHDGGTHPWHWTLGITGQRFQAAVHGRPEPTARAARQRAADVTASPTLNHLLTTNEFFVRLASHARHEPDARLRRWWSERRATAEFQTVRPDGHGIWTVGAHTVGLFLECDLGTERLARVAAKLDAYARLADSGGPRYPVLFWLNSAERERRLHTVLREHPGQVPVATATQDTDPAGPVWLPVDGLQRVGLTELPSSHGRPRAGNPNYLDGDLVLDHGW